jgi:hypothetical protein
MQRVEQAQEEALGSRNVLLPTTCIERGKSLPVEDRAVVSSAT